MLFLKRLIGFLIGNKVGWFFLKPFSRLGSYMSGVRYEIEQSRNAIEEERIHEDIFASIFHERKVLHGPFKGLQYPTYNAIGSTLYPKLLGSYERELHEVIEALSEKQFSEVINIGCGEGYYAIGLCRKFPSAKIFACDTDTQAIRLCQQMAALNYVADRMVFHTHFTASDLENFEFTGRGLIVCDCEGFEKYLFTLSNLDNLKECHLLIEVHDYIDIDISTSLTKLFSTTHTLKIIKSLDDIEKAKVYQYDETVALDLYTKKKLFEERRPAMMEWFYLTPENRTIKET
ncbi:MAG: methyltransferase [Cyclobacteriaceae bacterium]